MKLILRVAIMAGVLLTQGCDIQKKNLERFQNDMYQRVNPQQLQDWAISVIRTNEEEWAVIQLDVRQLPSFLTTTNAPVSVELEKTGHGKERMVFIDWGNGFGHWGLIVGETNLAMPKELHLRMVHWKPGIYFYQDLQ